MALPPVARQVPAHPTPSSVTLEARLSMYLLPGL